MASLNSIPSSINVFGAALFTGLQRMTRGSTTSGAALTISPFSIARALAMLLQGAALGSATRAQVLRVVFGSAGVEDADSLVALNAQLKQLAATLEQAGSCSDGDSGPTVADANSVWVRTGMALQPDFKNTLSQVFDAEVAPITTAAAGAIASVAHRWWQQLYTACALLLLPCALLSDTAPPPPKSSEPMGF